MNVTIVDYNSGNISSVINSFKEVAKDNINIKVTSDLNKINQGMNINEAEFNATADAMIRALNTAGISLSSRNRLLGIIASMRDQVIYQ